jgi:hypothetical protein
MIVRTNPQQELSEFYPPPYNFLGPQRCQTCRVIHFKAKGMGDVSSTQIQQIATTGASTTVSLLASLSVIGGPWGAAAAALIAVGSLIAGMFKGCGSSCVIASNDANKIEPLLQQNVQAYLSATVHTASLQAAALNNFDTVWSALTTACSDPSLGAAGQRCISDRQQGSCAYKTSPGGWQNGQYVSPGANGSGSTCWNWFVGYRDPIANDPTVVPDPAPSATANPVSSVAAGIDSLVSGSGFNLSSLLLPAALVGGVLLLMNGLGDL